MHSKDKNPYGMNVKVPCNWEAEGLLWWPWTVHSNKYTAPNHKIGIQYESFSNLSYRVNSFEISKNVFIYSSATVLLSSEARTFKCQAKRKEFEFSIWISSKRSPKIPFQFLKGMERWIMWRRDDRCWCFCCLFVCFIFIYLFS